MLRINAKEVERIKREAFFKANRPFLVQLMDKNTRTVIEEHKVNGWNAAHKFGYKLIKKAPDDQVVRLVDPKDASYYDFLTKARMEKVCKGGKYIGNEED